MHQLLTTCPRRRFALAGAGEGGWVERLLDGFPVVIEVPVAWGEMDAFEHVNNIVYFRYFESARMACFERLGMGERLRETGIGPILHSTSCRFRVPLTYPDTISVGTAVTGVGADRFGMTYRVVSHAHARTAADGEGTIVMYDYRAGEKASIPDDLRERLEALRLAV
jgi:acyl-CoA thioester hydrolase